ncbi:MAG: division/cell wall cluster transcriptional repressor MraZ [Candidatus Dojkabacteria bacterium]|nr:division/cell wall cluster transcriptional repressor MraZ [Candidatus Dojkabacteria bacterium]
MLIGEFTNKVGEKSRIALPKKFREILGESVIITRGYEDCIIVVNEKQWDKLLSAFGDQPFTKSSVRDTRRYLIGGASEINLDEQGRFVLPKNLKEFAEIFKEVTFIGLVDWVEIWSKEKWDKRMEMIKPNAAKIAEKLQEINEK